MHLPASHLAPNSLRLVTAGAGIWNTAKRVMPFSPLPRPLGQGPESLERLDLVWPWPLTAASPPIPLSLLLQVPATWASLGPSIVPQHTLFPLLGTAFLTLHLLMLRLRTNATALTRCLGSSFAPSVALP